MTLHRAAMSGRALCGELGQMSTTGAGPLITCETCRHLSMPDREDQLRQIATAAARFNERDAMLLRRSCALGIAVGMVEESNLDSQLALARGLKEKS